MKMKIRWGKLLSEFVIVMLLIVTITGGVMASSDEQFYMGEVKVKKDAGYGENTEMKDSDYHYGWDLGRFVISGFTRRTTDSDGNLVFLKAVGDEVELAFELNQDINKLNGDDSLVISNDTNGYDEYFGISKDERTTFGKGALLVKYTDYQNKVTYQLYSDYLKGVEKGANTELLFFQEGDYEIALDYEIRKIRWGIIPDNYKHYQILIKFSVRNANCMVYPFDVVTKSELVNTSFTENGFYLDLAKSRYLTIDVKKMNYVSSEGTLVEDTRYYSAAADGDEFTDEGVYIITVKNLYTGLETEKKIYVGTDPILKAYVTTGKDIEYIKEAVEAGAVINDDGTILLDSNELIEAEEAEFVTIDENTEEKDDTSNDVSDSKNNASLVLKIVLVLIGLSIIGVVVFLVIKKRGAKI